MGNVSRAMYPSTLMQSVIGAQYGVLYRLFVGIGGNGNSYTNKYHARLKFLLPKINNQDIHYFQISFSLNLPQNASFFLLPTVSQSILMEFLKFPPFLNIKWLFKQAQLCSSSVAKTQLQKIGCLPSF